MEDTKNKSWARSYFETKVLRDLPPDESHLDDDGEGPRYLARIYTATNDLICVCEFREIPGYSMARTLVDIPYPISAYTFAVADVYRGTKRLGRLRLAFTGHGPKGSSLRVNLTRLP